MSPSMIMCPATCELCGQWMPGHSKDCPRSGVHPSQWSFNNNDNIVSAKEQMMIETFTQVETDMQYLNAQERNSVTMMGYYYDD